MANAGRYAFVFIYLKLVVFWSTQQTKLVWVDQIGLIDRVNTVKSLAVPLKLKPSWHRVGEVLAARH